VPGGLDARPALTMRQLLAPKALLARLSQSLGLAAGDTGRPSRQRELRNTIAWSYDLLTRDLAEVFRRTGVFAGGCDLDAFAAITLADHGPGAGADPLWSAASGCARRSRWFSGWPTCQPRRRAHRIDHQRAGPRRACLHSHLLFRRRCLSRCLP
jgi:hypothetical protein